MGQELVASSVTGHWSGVSKAPRGVELSPAGRAASRGADLAELSPAARALPPQCRAGHDATRRRSWRPSQPWQKQRLGRHKPGGPEGVPARQARRSLSADLDLPADLAGWVFRRVDVDVGIA